MSDEEYLANLQKIDNEKLIQSLHNCGHDGYYNDLYYPIVEEIKRRLSLYPSEKSERKKGKWIEISWSELDPNVCCTSYEMQSAKYSVCEKYHTTPYLYSLDYFPYCPNCGAEMKRGE